MALSAASTSTMSDLANPVPASISERTTSSGGSESPATTRGYAPPYSLGVKPSTRRKVAVKVLGVA